VYAYEQSEKYKEGKFIIEREYMVKNTPPVIEDEKGEPDIPWPSQTQSIDEKDEEEDLVIDT